MNKSAEGFIASCKASSSRLEDHIIYWEQIASLEEKAIRLAVPHTEVETAPLNESSRGNG